MKNNIILQTEDDKTKPTISILKEPNRDCFGKSNFNVVKKNWSEKDNSKEDYHKEVIGSITSDEIKQFDIPNEKLP